MAIISKDTLMLVRDPESAIQALFEDPNRVITDSSFLKEYMRIKNLIHVGETKAETHLGTLRIFGLVESAPHMIKGNNVLTPRGKMLKNLWKNDAQTRFKKGLAHTILNNPHKGQLFKKFVNFVSRAKTIKEIEDEYGWRTSASLIAWCDLSKLIQVDFNRKYVVTKNFQRKNKPNINAIWLEVRNSYDEIRRLIHKKAIIVKYADLRFRCAYNFQLDDSSKFDEWFRNLMRSKYGQFINLHGTLVGDYDAYENLQYRNHLYPFVSLALQAWKK